MRICLQCGKDSLETARVCRHCGASFSARGPAAMRAPVVPAGQAASWELLSAEIPAGTRLREYRLEKLLGRGAMGDVYLGRHMFVSQEVAIKAAAPESMRDDWLRRRFLAEAGIMARLVHPNIVVFHNLVEECGRFFLIMQYVDGMSLQTVLERYRAAGRRLPLRFLVAVTKGVLSALAHAHSLTPPLVHRDIKPSNVLLDRRKQVLVADFGIAATAGPEQRRGRPGIVGTYEYMSPEQARSAPTSPAADVYSVGVMAFEMLAGRVPFPQGGDQGVAAVRGHAEEVPPRVEALRLDCPSDVAEIVHIALAKDPGARYADAQAMLEALGPVVRRLSSQASEEPSGLS